MSDLVVAPYSVPCMYCGNPVERPDWQTEAARKNPKLMDCIDCGNKAAAHKKNDCMRYMWNPDKRVWVDLA